MKMRTETWVAFGVVLGLAALLAAYYYVHKPIYPAQALALAAVLADAGAAGLVTLVGGAVGRRLLRRYFTSVPSAEAGGRLGQRVVVEVALGWGVVGLALLALGVAHLYYPALMWVLVAAVLGLLRHDVRGWLADGLQAVKALCCPQGLSHVSVSWPGLFVFGALGLSLLRALAPPLMWDALVYHLTLPKLYIQAHSVWLPGDFLFTGMPQLTEMLYTAAMLLRGSLTGIAPQTLGWAFGAVLALGVAVCAADMVGDKYAALAPAILFSSFTLALSLAWAYGELLMMLLTLAMLMTLRQWWRERTPGALVLAGVFAGLVVDCKYTGALVPLAGAVVVLAGRLFFSAPGPAGEAVPPAHKRSVRVRWALGPALVFSLAAAAAFVPWLVKNWAVNGSPTYPLLFPAGYMDALRLWFYNRPDLTDRNPGWAALIFLRATFLGIQGKISADGTGYDATLGPLLVCLLLGLAVGGHRLAAQIRREVWLLALFAAAGYAGWVVLNFVSAFAVQARLFFAIFPALALLAVAGLAALASFDTPALRLSVIVNAVVAFVLALSAWETVAAFAAESPLAYLTGAQDATSYREANLGWYAAAIDRVNALPPGSHVEFLWETRSLECRAADRCAPDVVIDRWWYLRRTLKTADAILADWKAQGFTHILIYDTGATFVETQPGNPFEPADWTELQTLRARLGPAENLGGVYSLYTLR
jgi:hypothetical protein